MVRRLALLLLLTFPASMSFGAPPAPRIVSLAPSITESFYAMGLGDRVAGVTRYCVNPPEAKSRPQVGGYLDPNYEAIVSLRPDLVALIAEHREARERLAALRIPVLAVDHSTPAGILDSLPPLAKAAGDEEKGVLLARELGERAERVRKAVAGRPPVRVMVVVGRTLGPSAGSGSGSGDIYVSGTDGYYDQLVAWAGGVNAYRERTLKFPALSAEGILRLDPEVIVEVAPSLAATAEARAESLAFWRSLPRLRAVGEGRVHLVADDWAVVPGPRFVLLLEELARILHPEVSW